MNIELEKKAIERLKTFEPDEEPYYLCYSGGKDSDTIRILAALAGVKHDIVNNHTTVDAPETVRYIRSVPNVKINYPDKTMWQLIVEHGIPPTRLVRYCCSDLKERGGKGRLKITGVRWAESKSRAELQGAVIITGKPKTTQKIAEESGAQYRVNRINGLIMNDDNATTRRVVEQCYRTQSAIVNPIVEWQDKDVWDFLNYYGCESNPLYKCGFKRIGCIGCPLGGYAHMRTEFKRYPKYKELYIHAFDRMLAKRKEDWKNDGISWRDGESVFRWWIGEDSTQLRFEDILK